MTTHLKALEPLSDEELEKLMTFRKEVDRGLVHRPGYAYAMAELQTRFDYTEGSKAKEPGSE